MDTVCKAQTSLPNCEHFPGQKLLNFPLITIIYKYISTYAVLPSCEDLYGEEPPNHPPVMIMFKHTQINKQTFCSREKKLKIFSIFFRLLQLMNHYDFLNYCRVDQHYNAQSP